MWHQTFDPNNRPYYFNDETNETTWEKPQELWTKLDHALAAANWAEYTTEDGRPYWYNKTTQTSVWQVPEGFASVEESSAGEASSTSDEDAQTASESFEAMLDRLDLKDSSYADVLSTLVRQESFWSVDSASERHRLFARYQKQQKLSARHQEAIDRENRIAALIKTLHSTFEDRDVDWQEAKDRLGLEQVKEHIYAFQQYKSQAEKEHNHLWQQRKADLLLKVSAALKTEPDWPELRKLFDATEINDAGPALEAAVAGMVEKELLAIDRQKLMRARKDRKARDTLRKRLAELGAAKRLNFKSEWKDVRSLIPEAEIEALCGTDGSSSAELFWDYIAQLKRKFAVQVGVVEDVLTKKQATVSELSLDTFKELFSNDNRVVDVDEIYEYLKSDGFSDRRRTKRRVETEKEQYHKPVLEY